MVWSIYYVHGNIYYDNILENVNMGKSAAGNDVSDHL